MNQQPVQGEVSSIGNGVRDERELKSINTKHLELTKLHRITRTALIVYTAQRLDKCLIGSLILIKIKQALSSIFLLAADWLS